MKKKPFIIFLSIFFLLLLIIGIYYVSKRQISQNISSQNTVIPANSAVSQTVQSSPTSASTLTDRVAISKAVAQKSGVALNQLQVTFTKDPTAFNELYAIGQVGPATGAGGGAIWYAAKVNGTWTIVAITQAPISCSLVNEYNLPRTMITTCLGSSNNLITR